jgi:VWFA-related protein
MTRLFRYGLFTACVLAVLAAAGAQQPVFRGTSDVVRVFVTVTDRDGRLVTTLEEKDFEIRDEGKIQPISLFDKSPQPIRLIVMLDVSGSMEGNLSLLRGASEQLFRRLLAEDRARVGAFGHEITISSSFTRDPDELRTALPRSIATDAPTPLWRAIDEALDAFGNADHKDSRDADHKDSRDADHADQGSSDGRPVILVLSDGKDSGPMGFRQRYVSQVEVIERARREDVMVYAIGMRSRSLQRPVPGLGPGGLQAALMADMPDPGLARVAEETGGGYTEIRFGQDLGAAFAQVADELHNQYLIGYAPPKRDGKVHEIDVRVSERGMKPRARKSYVAPKELK